MAVLSSILTAEQVIELKQNKDIWSLAYPELEKKVASVINYKSKLYNSYCIQYYYSFSSPIPTLFQIEEIKKNGFCDYSFPLLILNNEKKKNTVLNQLHKNPIETLEEME